MGGWIGIPSVSQSFGGFMNTLDVQQLDEVGGGVAALSNVLAAMGLGIAICTAPAWGAVGALVGMGVLLVKTLED